MWTNLFSTTLGLVSIPFTYGLEFLEKAFGGPTLLKNKEIVSPDSNYYILEGQNVEDSCLTVIIDDLISVVVKEETESIETLKSSENKQIVEKYISPDISKKAVRDNVGRNNANNGTVMLKQMKMIEDECKQTKEEMGDEIVALKMELSRIKKKKQQAVEEVKELREENKTLKQANEIYSEKLRKGIKCVTVYFRDMSETGLKGLDFQQNGIECFIEIGDKVGEGTSKCVYNYNILFEENASADIPKEYKNGVIKYYASATCNALADYDCKKQWYLSDKAKIFAKKLECRGIPKFIDCAKVIFDDGNVAIIEPKLKNFERITNNLGDGVIELDDILSSFSHFVFEESGHKYIPCDFQGDVWSMNFTDPEINTWSDDGTFLGIQNYGKHGVQACLWHHLSKNCATNAFCQKLGLNPNFNLIG